jgi:hypothetical protein
MFRGTRTPAYPQKKSTVSTQHLSLMVCSWMNFICNNDHYVNTEEAFLRYQQSFCACNIYPPILRNLYGYYRVHTSLSSVPMLSQTKTIPALLPQIPSIHFILSHPPNYTKSSNVLSTVHLLQPKLFEASNMSYPAETVPCSLDQVLSTLGLKFQTFQTDDWSHLTCFRSNVKQHKTNSNGSHI